MKKFFVKEDLIDNGKFIGININRQDNFSSQENVIIYSSKQYFQINPLNISSEEDIDRFVKESIVFENNGSNIVLIKNLKEPKFNIRTNISYIELEKDYRDLDFVLNNFNHFYLTGDIKESLDNIIRYKSNSLFLFDYNRSLNKFLYGDYEKNSYKKIFRESDIVTNKNDIVIVQYNGNFIIDNNELSLKEINDLIYNYYNNYEEYINTIKSVKNKYIEESWKEDRNNLLADKKDKLKDAEESIVGLKRKLTEQYTVYTQTYEELNKLRNTDNYYAKEINEIYRKAKFVEDIIKINSDEFIFKTDNLYMEIGLPNDEEPIHLGKFIVIFNLKEGSGRYINLTKNAKGHNTEGSGEVYLDHPHVIHKSSHKACLSRDHEKEIPKACGEKDYLRLVYIANRILTHVNSGDGAGGFYYKFRESENIKQF